MPDGVTYQENGGVPPIPLTVASPRASCVGFTLADMITAFQNASANDQATFLALVQPPEVEPYQLTAEEIDDALKDGSPSVLADIKQTLEIENDPPYELTMGDLNTVMGGALDSEKQTFALNADLVGTLTPGNLLATVERQDPDDTLKMGTYICFDNPKPTFTPPIVTVVEEAAPMAKWLPGPVGTGVALAIALKEEEEKVESIKAQIQTYGCDGLNNRKDNVLTVPVMSDGDISQAMLFQEIFNQFAMLLRCCSPCQYSDFTKHVAVITSAQQFTSESGAIVSVRLRLLNAEVDPDVIWRAAGTAGGPQNILIGKFWWHFADGTNGEELFIDKDMMEMKAPRGDATGFVIIPSKAGLTIEAAYMSDLPGTLTSHYNEPTIFGNNGIAPPVTPP